MDLPTEDAYAAAVAKSMTCCLRFDVMSFKEREGGRKLVLLTVSNSLP